MVGIRLAPRDRGGVQALRQLQFNQTLDDHRSFYRQRSQGFLFARTDWSCAEWAAAAASRRRTRFMAPGKGGQNDV